MSEQRAVDGSYAGAVLFDVDGTLIDTAYLHAVTWWQAFRQAGLTVPMARVHRAIGMGSDHLLDHLLGPDRDKDGDSALGASHDALFAAYWPSLQPFDGAARLLHACQQRGWRVVLASSAKDDELSAMRAALDAESSIDAVTGASDVESSKPAPDLVEQALERAGVPPERAVFVGDTRWDVEAAARAGVPCVGMLSGGWSRAELEQAGAVEVYEGPAELLGKLDGSVLSQPSKD
ncbi:MAG TPA: HAD family hydrolase [Actinocrinis sp.]|nr:HAD family hydrolase [Actinocrinis sp.]